MSNWISVNERLPEDDTTVLVHRPEMLMKIITGFYNQDHWYYDDGQLMIEVTHWRYLPDPPKVLPETKEVIDDE